MIKRREINRRQFIKRAAGTAAAAISFPYIVPASAFGNAGDLSLIHISEPTRPY